jgi:ABC-type transport system involved in cytochrome c biogenesis ATPase subunit
MPDRPPTPGTAGRTVLLRARDLAYAHAGVALFSGLSFDILPGLTLVCGGEGRGKSTLLRLIGGEATPSAGRVVRVATSVFHADAHDTRDDPLTARAWLQAWRERSAGWDPAMQAALIDGFALPGHLDKHLYMLSTGTRRKVWLTAAFASGASLTLLDMPYAALDAAARDLLTACLADAAARSPRAWVIADYELPETLSAVARAGTIDLGE